MALTNILASALIFIGILLMSYNVATHWLLLASIRRYSPAEFQRIRTLAWVHLLLMVFFSFGYIIVLAGLIEEVPFGNLFIGSILFFGSIFVLLGIRLQSNLLKYIRNNYDKLLKAHFELEARQVRLGELDKERNAAQESERLKSDFLSLVSHELRTPLTSIFGFTKLIRKDLNAYLYSPLTKPESEKRLQRLDTNLDIISNECNRLTRMVNNLLNLAKIESGQMVWHDQCVSPFPLLKRSFALLQGIIKEQTHLRFVLDVDEDVPDLNVDPDLMIQVVINLVFNAIKNTSEGEIRLHAVKEADGVLLSVSDTGTGISEEHLEMIFDKFQVLRHGDTMLGGSTGTGLGLAICREIVTHYGGSIWAESELNKGSTFFIKLPAVVYAESSCP